MDGEWITDHTAPQEEDGSNNINNVLDLQDIQNHTPNITMSGLTPQSTTVDLASKVPSESERSKTATNASSDVPGTFPETPANEASEFNVNPIPATSGPGNPINLAPGEKVPDPSTLTSNTVSSTAKDDPSLHTEKEDLDQAFGVNPIPATGGMGNPINLPPGEKVPDPGTITGNTISSTVTTDKDSYERGGNQAAPRLPDVVTPDDERRPGAGMFDLPPLSKNMIPESSLPMGGDVSRGEKDTGPTIQSAGAGTSTAALAAQVPLEPRGTAEVLDDGPFDDNQQMSDKSTGVTGSSSQAPATKTTGPLPTSVQKSIDRMNAGSGIPIASVVPDVVQESIADSTTSPEAAGDGRVVQEKSAMEDELLHKVKPEEGRGEPAPTASAVATGSTPTATLTSHEAPTTATDPSKPASAASVTKTEETVTSPTAPPGTTSADVPAKTPATEEAASNTVDSRDISPMTKPNTENQTQPMVTSGLGTTAAPAASSSTPNTPTTPTTDKKSKRASGFFGKLKAKFSDKDKK